MSSQSATNLELLEEEVLSGQFRRSSPGVIQQPFADAARQDTLNAIANVIAEKHQIQKPTDDNLMVVHYTAISGVISMLQDAEVDALNENPDKPRSNYLRMYSTVGSNDPGEGTYLNRFLPNDIQGRNASDNVARSEPQKETHQYSYVASFIRPNDQGRAHEAADNLVFWRSYGREGTGCSLTVQVPRHELRAVIYGEKDTKDNSARLTNEIGRLLAVAKRLEEKAGVSLESLNEAIDFAMERVRYFYKSEAYRYEQECRIVETPATIEGTAMRPFFEHSGPPGQERTKRYINNPMLAINKLFVSGTVITLGPRVPNVQDTKEYMEQLLTEAGSIGSRVQCSEIEYRNPTNR